jgi:hypothetical protein
MFDHGIEQNVAVEDLTVVVSESHMHAKKKKAMEEEAVTPEGGEDSSKASKKGKPEMPMEKLKAIMEKKKSEAYKAMLRSQGKMEEETELDEKKLTSAEMKKREEVAKAIERDQPEMPMGKKMAIATATAKKVAEAKAHTVPKTAKEKSLAALAAPHDKITHADVMVGRGVSKKKTMKEFVEKLVESLDLTEAKANLHLHSYDGAEPVRHEIHGLSNTKKNSSHVFKTMTAAVAKKTGQSHADVKDAMEAHEDRHVHGMPKEEGEKVVVHKSVDDYVKHHLSTDAKNVKDSLGG